MPFHDTYARLTPYERLLPGADFPERRFAAIRAEAERRGVALDDPATFALLEPAVEALGEWMSEEGDPDALVRYALLLFHAYHHHAAGTPVFLLETSTVRCLLDTASEERWSPANRPPAPASGPPSSSEAPSSRAGPPRSLYLQLPQHLVWARLEDEGPPTSIDGIYRTATPDGRLHVLPVGGLMGDRPGFTVITVPSAPSADEPGWISTDMRETGDDFFSSMPGAEIEGLYELTTAGEALKLVARAVRYLDAHPERVREADAAPAAATNSSPLSSPPPSTLPWRAVVEDPSRE